MSLPEFDSSKLVQVSLPSLVRLSQIGEIANSFQKSSSSKTNLCTARPNSNAGVSVCGLSILYLKCNGLLLISHKLDLLIPSCSRYSLFVMRSLQSVKLHACVHKADFQ